LSKGNNTFDVTAIMFMYYRVTGYTAYHHN